MIAIGVIVFVITLIVVLALVSLDHTISAIITSVVGVLATALCIIIGVQSNGFKRFSKDIKSNYSSGIHRTITITAEDGRMIYTYSGTIDLEIDASGRKIKFEDEDGNRQIIIYGIQDTVTIIEK